MLADSSTGWARYGIARRARNSSRSLAARAQFFAPVPAPEVHPVLLSSPLTNRPAHQPYPLKGTAVHSTLVALLLKFALGELKKHPEIVKEVADKIPGRIDDIALRLLVGLL